ncbi:glycoside hydrolase family 2 TIM barrel-domain containing protein [Comamonas sp. GB3 AK4-5]|uniref:glycoside hydrolase family 2 TIM barrel-domain containing protein n=1 Tax=Comamonas sp. GB3 AK4-5 TaxID=3231487 RepID=UPI00351E22E7
MPPRFQAKHTALAVVLMMAFSSAMAARSSSEPRMAPVTVEAVRGVSTLAVGWKFIQDDALTDAQALASDGATWSTVTLPHTWNALDAASTAQTSSTSVGYKRGIGWYRLEVDVPVSGALASGATRWLQFNAASLVSDVWLNGEKLGQHKGGFSGFRYDVSSKLRPGQRNVLLVKADNSEAKTNTDPTAIAPFSGDFNVSGGLYRDVQLLSTPSLVHIALDDLGSSGVFAQTQSIQGGKATVSVRTKLKNGLDTRTPLTVRTSLLEADAKTVKSTSARTLELEAGAQVDVAQALAVPQAHLWQGLADPYLYQLVVEVQDAQGKVLDKVVQGFGIRQMNFDKQKGFVLNGKPVPLRGVNMHQDFLHKGWAINKADTDQSLALIKEIGATTVRLSHYPHSTYTFEQADKMGLVVIAEIPFVNAASVASPGVSCNVDPETTGFAENAREQLRTSIRQNFNHASIGLWSIGNEVTMDPHKCGQNDASNNVQGLLRTLHALAKAEDPGRITTLASEGGSNAPAVTLSPIPDAYSVNRYFLWYGGDDPQELGRLLDKLQTQTPNKPIGITEYGAGAALTHYTDNPLGGRICASNRAAKRICYQPEGYANYVHEKSYAAIAARPFLYGTYAWNMFDFGSGTRHEGDIGGTNTKGLVTFDRLVKKDVFYYYKAQWSKEAVTHITDRRYTDRAYPVADVKVYSNGQSVTLKHNGTSVGRMDAAQCPLKVCTFKAVPLSAGRNELVAEGQHGSQRQADTVVWHVSPEAMQSRFIAAGQLASGLVSNDALLGSHKFGSDHFFAGGKPSNFTLARSIKGLGLADMPEQGLVWDAYRHGPSFSYDIPLANGDYAVTLGFFEPTAKAAGERVFNVMANGAKVVADMDIFARAGAVNTATSANFKVAVKDGRLQLGFHGVAGDAIVSNISVVRQ